MWVGPFDLLRSGDGDHERGVREAFREDAGDEQTAPARPIADDEVDDFVEFLQTLEF